MATTLDARTGRNRLGILEPKRATPPAIAAVDGQEQDGDAAGEQRRRRSSGEAEGNSGRESCRGEH
jgi:hypothetical protein